MSLQLSGKEFEEIRDGFKEIDKDGNGTISLSEFKECLLDGKEDEDEAVNFYMHVYDLDQNGSIEFPEFLEIIAYFRYKKKPNQIQIKQMFRALDKNKQGVISSEDLKRFYRIFSSDDLPDESSLNLLIRQLDINGDGKISFTEFSKNYKMFEKHSSNIRM